MINKFLIYLEVEKRYSPHTIVSYQKDLKDFLIFYTDTEGSDTIELAHKRAIRNFMVYLNEKKLSKRSINRKISSLRSFYVFLLKVGEITHSPMETITSLKVYPEKQVPMSEEEMYAIEENLAAEDNILTKCIIEILYQTGIRRAELCGLLVENVFLDREELKIIGKGNKERLVPISSELVQILTEYQKLRRPQEGFETYFLLNNKGKKLTEKFVYLQVNKYLSVVTSKQKKSPHILRHSFATHVLNNGAEISKVQAILGHSSLASTQVYTNANIEQLKKVFNQAHPRALKNE